MPSFWTSSAGASAAKAADTQDEQGIELQEASQVDKVLAGSISEVDVNGTRTSSVDNVAIKLGDFKTGKEVKATKIVPQDATAAVEVKDTDYAQYYLTKATSTTKDAVNVNGGWYTKAESATTTAGTKYLVVVKKTEDFKSAVKAPMISFTVTADSLEGAYVTTATTANGTTTYPEKDLAWDGVTTFDKLVVTTDGKTAATANSKAWYKDGEKITFNEPNTEANTVVTPGSYTLVATGADGKQAQVSFTVAKMDLATAGLYIDEATGTQTISNVKFDNGKGFISTTKLTASELTATTSPLDLGKPGSYTMTVSAKADTNAAKLVEGTATIEYGIVAKTDATVKYGDTDLGAVNSWDWATDSSLDEEDVANGKIKSFDASKLSASYVDGFTGKTVKVGSDGITVTMKDKKTKEVVDSVAEDGEYVITVKLDASANGYEHGSSLYTINLTVSSGAIDEKGVTFYYKNEVTTNSASKTDAIEYSGDDILDQISTKVRDTKGNLLAEGTDYTLTVQKTTKADGTTAVAKDPTTGDFPVVDSIVDAGTYTVTVKSDKYAMPKAAQQITVKVNPITVPSAVIAEEISYTEADGKTTGSYVPFTGEEIVPTLQYTVKDEAGKDVKKTIPAEAYVATYTYGKTSSAATKTAVDAVEAEGFYTMAVTKAKTDMAENYNLTNVTSFDFEVAGKQQFYDVTSTDWFYGVVNEAAKLGYVKGIGDTKTYAPNASMTRADVCVVLFRMAGGTEVRNVKYQTKFADVDPEAYFAQAVQWASQAGIVKGYDGTDNFGPMDNVTRDQFATMLARYASLKDGSATADASVLDGYADADQVESFAKDAVAWAVANEVMGQNTDVLAPTKDVSRAEVAAMAVRYQPKKIEGLITIK